jgi:hypothetical protein
MKLFHTLCAGLLSLSLVTSVFADDVLKNAVLAAYLG